MGYFSPETKIHDIYSMSIHIIEFKAKISDPEAAEQQLLSLQPFFKGEDRQVDTYFNVATGRLKLREGNIENALIWYDRPNEKGSKLSTVHLYRHQPDASLKEILTQANGIKVIVDKKRKIYFVDNVKFHFDEVKGLGRFIEVEAIDETGELGIEKIQQQCDHYAAFFAVRPDEFMTDSYSDMLLKQS
ncbi:MAG: class IV adenylate cyclase [Ferruginibacter sp.]